jgi:predicted metal-dependent hydrolase
MIDKPMTEKEFLKLFWKIATILKYKKNIIDIVFIKDESWDKFGMCSVQDESEMMVIYFNTNIFEEPRQFCIEVIIEELIHLKYPIHDMSFIKVLKLHFVKLKNL